MKLTTRLSIVVGIMVTLLSISVGSFAIITSHDSEIKSVSSILNSATKETANSKEDKYVVALSATTTSPLPLSAALLTNADQLSYLVENSASIQHKPVDSLVTKALRAPVLVEKSFLFRAIQTGTNQFLIYSISIKAAQNQSSSLIKRLVLFVLLALIISISLTHFFFRRDSKINELSSTLKRNNERMQEFLGDASHELRTPLTVIKGYAELMSKDPTNPEIPRYLKTVMTETKRMERLISELLMLAELGESKKTRTEKVDLTNWLTIKIEELRDLSPSRNISVDIEKVEINSNSELIETLLGNIFTNIVRHTPTDAAVNVSLAKMKNHIQLVIEDAGPGLKDFSQQAFSRFDKSRSRETGGSGLGLSIIHKIVENIGGEIELSRSNLGGLKTEIRLPN